MFVWSKDEIIVLPIMLIVIILIAVILGVALRKRSDKIRAIPLQIIAIVVLVLEIIKQIINIVEGYDTWTIPLHYCSMFVFFFPLAQLCGKRCDKIFKPVAFTTSLAMFFLFYFNPGSIISDSAGNVFGSFSNFHTFTFHHLIILYVVLTISLKNYLPQKKDWICVLIVMGIYYVVGMSMAHILDTNYCNFLTSNIPFMESLRLKAGQTVYSIVMLFIITGGTTLLAYLTYLFYILIMNIKLRKRI